jgi:predicted phosphodiesterase
MALGSIQRELDCNILLCGNTHEVNAKVVDNKLCIDPGSISGTFSNCIADP